MNSMLGFAVGVFGLAFLGYCVYFDNKRRSDPNFKKKLRERRKVAREKEAAAARSNIPSFQDAESINKFFLQQVQLGEAMLAQGDISLGIEHLANAIAVCSQPQQLLKVLRNTLPPAVYDLLLQQVGNIVKQPQLGSIHPQILGMAEEDVE